MLVSSFTPKISTINHFNTGMQNTPQISRKEDHEESIFIDDEGETVTKSTPVLPTPGTYAGLSPRLQNFEINKKLKIDRIRAQLPDDLEECTFEPKINRIRN